MSRARVAGLAALLSGLLLTVELLLAWSVAVPLGYRFGAVPLLSLLPAATVGVVAVGGALLWRGHRTAGTALVASTSLLALPLAADVVHTLAGSGPDQRTLGAALVLLGAVGSLFLAAVLGLRTVPSRPPRRPAHPGVLVLVAVAATGLFWPVVSTQVPLELFDATAWSRPLAMTALDGLDRWRHLLTAVVPIALLLYAATTARRVGALVVVAVVLPWLAGDLGSAVAATREAAWFFTPAGWLSLAGQGGLLLLAAAWWRRGEPLDTVFAVETDEQPTTG
ncbi:hypothetical protein [Egicoccus halophilus]|uniref:hypothetical protein n=1 Tax=Egicoccus halophilus TaxID=1670830 RepID=UPI001031CFC6|nr:hypothetical protein [Egicoccus halophilus]